MPENKSSILPTQANLDYEKKMSSLNSEFDNLLNTPVGVKDNPYKQAQLYSYDAQSKTNPNTNFERYYAHSDYDKLGFNPWRDNEAIYNEQGSVRGDIWRATKSAGNLAITGFKSVYRSYGDLFSGNALDPDYDSANEMRYWNAIGSSSRGGVAGFTSNLITNSGYTLGLVGSMALESLALTGLEYITGGTASPLAAARIGKFGKDLGKISTAIEGLNDTMKAFKQYGVAKSAWQAVKSGAKYLNPLENTTELLTGAKNIEKFKELGDLAKASKTAGAFYRDVQAANLTLAESKMEGASAETDLEEQLIREYKDGHNGYEPGLKEYQAIKEAAKDAGTKTLAWNIPAIYLTNKITFEPLLNPVEHAVKGSARGVAKMFIEQEGKGIVKANLKNTFTASLKPRGLLGNTIGYFKRNLSEGIQESVQEVISGTAKDYYKSLYDNSGKQGLDFANGEYQSLGVWDAIAKNAADQFSGKGFETFASGFLMGGLIGAAGSAVSLPYKAVREYRAEKSKYRDAQLKTLNEVYKNPLKYFGAGIINYSNGTASVAGQATAENNGDVKEWLDLEHQNLTSHVMSSLETGTYDIMLDRLNSIKNMDPEAIKDAYGIDGGEALSKIDKIISRAERIKSNYEQWTDRYENPFNPKNFKPGTEEHNQETFGYVSWEAAKKVAVFNDTALARNVERIKGIADDLLSMPELAGVSGNDVSILFSASDVQNEIRLLDNEIEVLEGSEIKTDRSVIRSKREKRKTLENYFEKLQNHYVGQHFSKMTREQKTVVEKAFSPVKKVSRDQLRNAYYDYISYLAESQQRPTPINNMAVEKSFDKLLDAHELGQDNVYYSSVIDTLSNPRNFIEQHKRLSKVFSDLYATREEDVKKGIENMQARIEDNTILKALFDRGFALNPEAAEKLLKDKEIPLSFYDVNAKQVVDDRSSKYEEFKNIVKNYVEATKPEETVEEPVAKETETKPQPEQTEEKQSEVEKTQRTKQTPINFEGRFGRVKNGEQLENLVNELTRMLQDTKIEDRIELGLNAQKILEFQKTTEARLLKDVTIENIKKGNIVAMMDVEQGNGVVEDKTSDYIVVRLLGTQDRVTIEKDNLKKSIKFKYSEDMNANEVIIPEGDGDVVKQNNTKTDSFLSKNREELAEIIEDAFSREKEFEEEFENELGCK